MGKLVLVAELPDLLKAVLRDMESRGRSMHEAEIGISVAPPPLRVSMNPSALPRFSAVLSTGFGNSIAVLPAKVIRLKRSAGRKFSIARRIIAFRLQSHDPSPFKAPADLLQIRGIGPKTLQAMTPLLRFDGFDPTPQRCGAEPGQEPVGLCPPGA